jgi:hypothetical protein
MYRYFTFLLELLSISSSFDYVGPSSWQDDPDFLPTQTTSRRNFMINLEIEHGNLLAIMRNWDPHGMHLQVIDNF